jgi:Na+-translocating ferredoxin:NAD+ oxidoreductase subunit B
VPVRGSLKPELMKTMEPHLDIDAHFKRHERFVVLPCVCKRERELQGHYDCMLPMKRCGFVGLPPQTPLGENVVSREEADKLLRELEQLGHVHQAFYGFTMGAESPQFVGTCNCCSCCCGVLHGQKISGVAEGPQRSNYRAVIDPEECVACGECIERCPVDAIAEDEDNDKKSLVEREKCIGCGVCVIGCPTDAIELEPVSAEEWFHTPSSMAELEERRLEYLAAEK